MPTATVTRQQLVELVMALPDDRLPSVYDFARFVQSHPLELAPSEDIFGETADEIHVDESLWEQQFAASRADLRNMAKEAPAAYHAGQTHPMEFTPDGKPIR